MKNSILTVFCLSVLSILTTSCEKGQNPEYTVSNSNNTSTETFNNRVANAHNEGVLYAYFNSDTADGTGMNYADAVDLGQSEIDTAIVEYLYSDDNHYILMDNLAINSLEEREFHLLHHSQIIDLQKQDPFEGIFLSDSAISDLSKLIAFSDDSYEQLLINNLISAIQLVNESGDINRFKNDVEYLNEMWEAQYAGISFDESGPYISGGVLGILKGSIKLWEEDIPLGDSKSVINVVLADLVGFTGSLYIGIGVEVFFGGADMTTSDIKTIVGSAVISGLFSSATGGFGLIGKLLKW